MCSVQEIDKRKVKAYNLLRQINRAMVKAKEWQAELNRTEEEIHGLEESNSDGLT